MTVPAIISNAEANAAYVRGLLKQRQPEFAAALAGWLHAAYRAEVEDAGHRLDCAVAANTRLATEHGLRGPKSASHEKVAALLSGRTGGTT